MQILKDLWKVADHTGIKYGKQQPTAMMLIVYWLNSES